MTADLESDAQDAERKALGLHVNATCVPIFIGQTYLMDGRGPETLSATGTLIQFERRIYLVTCNHVREIAYERRGYTASIAFGRAVINLHHITGPDPEPALRGVWVDGFETDISVVEIPHHFVEMMNREKLKVPINLDDFVQPNWTEVAYCLAAGFPMRLKHLMDDPGVLASPMVEVIAELISTPTDGGNTVTLHSKLDRPLTHGLSGLSGGPIFALSGVSPPLPAGIVFEGHPSGEAQEGNKAFLEEDDILIRGLILTPRNFASWLQNRR